MVEQPVQLPSRSSSQRWRPTDLVAALVLLAGFLLRIGSAAGTFLNPDEALHFRLANQVSLNAVYRAGLTESHPPLLYWLLHFWRALGTSELWLRLPSVIAGTVFCWLFLRWLTRVLGPLPGFLGLMFVALLPPVVRLSAEVRQYALLLAFLSGALYCLERALDENSPRLMSASVLCVYLGMLSHYSALFFVAGLSGYALLKFFGGRRHWSGKVITIWVVGQLGALALLWFLYETHLSHLGQGESRTVLQGWMSEYYLRRSYFEAGHDNPLLFAVGHSFGVFQFVFGHLAVGDIAGVLFLAALGMLWRAQGGQRTALRQLALFLLFLFALACGAGLAHLYPYGGTRHTAYLIIPAVAGVSFAVSRLAAGRWTRAVALAGVVIAVCAVFGKQHQPYMTRADQSREQMTEAMAFLRQSVAPGGMIFTDFESSLVLGHYLCEQRTVSLQASNSEFETFSCAGYKIVSANRRAGTNFTPESFLTLGKNLVQSYGLKASEPVWIFQAGWDVSLPDGLRQRAGRFQGLVVQSFGNHIRTFKLTVGQSGNDLGLAGG